MIPGDGAIAAFHAGSPLTIRSDFTGVGSGV